MEDAPEAGEAMLERLAAAASRRDLDELVECFTVDYRNESPVHPAQGFTGRAQVRRNWEFIFAALPDITARVLRSCSSGEAVWSEWEMTGTRPDGAAMQMAGVIILGIRAGQFSWARWYLEPVQAGGPDADAAVRERVGSRPAPGGGPGPSSAQ